MPRLTILIVTYNSRGEIDACLESLVRQPPAVDHQIVIVDNASRDDTAGHVRANFPTAQVIEAGGNLGFAGANNLGIRQTTSELVLLLNPDTIVPAGVIDTLVAAVDAAPGVAIAGPRVVDRTGRAELSFGRMVSPLAELRQKVLVSGHDRGMRVVTRLVERATRRRQMVDWVSGVCLLVRRADLEAAGLLDERFFIYLEDVDLCATVRAHGRAVLFEPRAEIVHLRGRSVATAPVPTHAAYRRSQMAFYEKHHPRWVPLLRGYLWIAGGRR
jgi:N-acetylglucosaminyl-diphospho-decaprenol L-rhamnosyltransferase